MSTFVGGKAAVQFRKDMDPLFNALDVYEKYMTDPSEWGKVYFSDLVPEDRNLIRAFRKIKKTYGLFPEKPKAAKAVTKKATKKVVKKTSKKK